MIKYGLPLLALMGVLLAVYTVTAQNKPTPVMPPVAQPASAPYSANVPGAGLVEPSTEFIAVGTHAAGVVTQVFVKANDRVKAGDPLFTIDDRALRSELAAREATARSAQASLDRMLAMPRAEDIPPAEAKLLEAQSQLADAQAQLAFFENLPDKRAISANELSTRRFTVATANTRVEQAKADLALIKAGAWKPDLDIAKANLESARAEVDRMRTDLDRLTMKAPVDADVLKVNIRAGEFATTGALATPLIVLGDTGTMHIRVDIDENDAWRVRPGAKGMAYIRGNSKLSTPIEFVRFEPYVIPKRSLTGSSSERVDTRVLQALYRFNQKDFVAKNKSLIFVGQQMDVFLESDPIGDARFGTDPAQAEKDLAPSRN
ncbi:MAG: biotin/lipoyl-binding protein [Phycisphaerales bacterium]|nr:biotin/lipoyl-binding protein [Phycisphaerales bacterium]